MLLAYGSIQFFHDGKKNENDKVKVKDNIVLPLMPLIMPNPRSKVIHNMLDRMYILV